MPHNKDKRAVYSVQNCVDPSVGNVQNVSWRPKRTVFFLWQLNLFRLLYHFFSLCCKIHLLIYIHNAASLFCLPYWENLWKLSFSLESMLTIFYQWSGTTLPQLCQKKSWTFFTFEVWTFWDLRMCWVVKTQNMRVPAWFYPNAFGSPQQCWRWSHTYWEACGEFLAWIPVTVP